MEVKSKQMNIKVNKMSKVKEEGGGSRLNTNKAATSRLFSSRLPPNFKFVSSQAKPENWIKYASLIGFGLH